MAAKRKRSDATKQWEAKAKELAKPLSESLSADVLVYAGSLFSFWDFQVGELIRSGKDAPNLICVLTTYGGSADSAFRLGRWVQELYGEEGTTHLLVDTFCKSAGTLLAIGFEEIIMSEDAEFGPLDVQLRKADEIEERTSGLTATQAMSTLRMEAYQTFEQILVKLRQRTGISSKIASDVAMSLSVGLFAPIYAQMEPLRLGENQRAMLIAEDYGRRLQQRSGSLKDKALEKLIGGYPSHEFVIDRWEAGEIFERLRMTAELEKEFAAYLRPRCVQHVCSETDGEEIKPPFVRFWSYQELHGHSVADSKTSETIDANLPNDNLRANNGQPESQNGAAQPEAELQAVDLQERQQHGEPSGDSGHGQGSAMG